MTTMNGYINPYQPVLLHLSTCDGFASVPGRVLAQLFGVVFDHIFGMWDSMRRKLDE